MPGIGIGVSPHFGGGQKWTRYWLTRKPTNLIINAQTDTTIDFSWAAGADAPEGFKLKISTDGVTYTDKATVAGNVTTAQATELAAGALYYFKVVAYKGTNESDPTNIYDTRFKITVDTTKAGSAADTFILPNYISGTYDYYVDWGDDGAEEHITTAGNHTHKYAIQGTYQIKIRGTFPRIYFNNGGDKAKLMDINSWGNIKWGSFAEAFHGCAALTGTYIDCPNMAAVTTCYGTFFGCLAFNGRTVGWNTANVTTMFGMFFQCYKFNQPIAHFNTGKVTNMVYMLYSALSFNQPLTFNIEAVTTMDEMFSVGVPLSHTNYDATLIAWAAQTPKNNVILKTIGAKYGIGAATTARGVLTGTYGWTITDGGQTSFNNGKLVISADDGYKSFYTKVLPLCTKKGIKATVYTIGSAIGLAGDTFMTWTEVAALVAAGFDVQCHTYNHLHLGTLSEAEVLSEYTDMDDAYVAHSLAAPTHTAYPFGESTANVRTWTATLRNSARGTTEGKIELATDKFNLPAYSISNTTQVAMSRVGPLLNAIKRDWNAMILYMHGVDGAGDITSAELEAVIDYAQGLGIDIITHSELYALLP